LQPVVLPVQIQARNRGHPFDCLIKPEFTHIALFPSPGTSDRLATLIARQAAQGLEICDFLSPVKSLFSTTHLIINQQNFIFRLISAKFIPTR
jgi:hypothetical protein